MNNALVREPIAIVGMASRLPGAPNLSAFWDMLMRGGDAVSEEVPAHLRDNDWAGVRTALGNPDANRFGAFFDRIDEFDAGFFGLSPREATRMSPVQRMLMETVWEAIEDAGVRAEALAGSRTAVFTSCLLNSEYWDMLVDRGVHDMHGLLGAVMHGAASGRIAYAFDLRGPNMAVDATCAGSMMALHLACRSIQYGESEAAIVGSVNLQLDVLHTTALARGRVISPTGASRFGDSEADGYVRSDGSLAVFLKPLDKALADGDRVYATILGSGTSSAGRGSSLVAPSATEQITAIRAAHADAGVQPSDIDYVEAHGTGTVEGDRTELKALGEVLGGPRDQPCLVGSAKSNFGHTEAASGLVGVVKTALAMWHGTIPRTLHVRNPNEVFDDPSLPLRLVAEPSPWPSRGARKYAGVSAFGMSGSNVHVVLGDAPAVPDVPADPPGLFVLPVSARSAHAVSELAQAYAKQIEADASVYDICFSAGVRRTHHSHRVAVVGRDARELAEGLRELASGGRADGVVVGQLPVREAPRVAFVFPGQGSQWAGMGRELFHSNEVFRERLLQCDAAVCAELGWSLAERLISGAELPDNEVQPVLWAMQVSLAAVWRSWGLAPDVLIGHSMGEIAAATVSGALSIADGAAIVCRRNALLDSLRGRGAMVAVHVGEEEARAAIGEYAGSVSVAVVNSAHSTVLAGDAAALEAVVAPLRDKGVLVRQVQVDFASHSPQVASVLPAVKCALSSIRPQAGSVPVYSTVLGRAVGGDEFDGAYWAANLRSPVRFAAAIEGVLADGRPTLFVEVSPHPVLVGAIEESIAQYSAASGVVGSLRRDAPLALVMNLAEAYVQGCWVDWERVLPGGRYVALPPYPWQRRRFWIDKAPDSSRRSEISGGSEAEPESVEVASGADFLSVLSDLLGMSVGEIDTSASLPMLGMDSVLATALRARIRRQLGADVPVTQLLSAKTVGEVAEAVAAAR
jgi:acyl transferase domain-containing protein